MVSAVPAGFASRYEAVAESASGDLRSLQQKAWERFEELGLPGRKDEDWRDLNFSALEKTFSEGDNAAPGGAAGAAVYTALPPIVLGSEAQTLPAGVSVEPVQAGSLPEGFNTLAEGEPHPFNLLNTALFAQAFVLRIEAALEEPLHVMHALPGGGNGVSLHPRLFVEVAPNVECTLIEQFPETPKGMLHNPVTEVRVGPGSRVNHYRLVAGSGGGWHVGSVSAGVGRDALYRNFSLALEGAFNRVDVRVQLLEPGAETELLGAYAGDGSQILDHHTRIDHRVRDTKSRQLYRGILSDTSRAVFNGRIVIAEDAQRASADQVNNNLLLSDKALVNSNPQLEIFADDVSCRHGSTIGQLDDAKVFYLRSRGFDKDTARAILTQAFLDEVLEHVSPESLKDFVHENIRERFFAGV